MPKVPDITIFCDSLSSIYLIQKAIHYPHMLTECKHAPLLLKLRSLILDRARGGLHTLFQKVNSHIGIIGNERADEGAAVALSNPDTCQYNLSLINNQFFSNLPAWPCLPPCQRDGASQPHNDTAEMVPRFAPDLTASITKHLVDHNPHVTDGPPLQDCPTYTRSQMINTISLPLYNNYMWRSATCTWSMIRKILQFRTNTYFTAARAFIIKRQLI